jgi:hypothetical protein
MQALQEPPITITGSFPDQLADQLVAPLPFGKPIQRMAWGLFGVARNLFESRALHDLVIGVDYGKPDALNSYWKNRSVSFQLLPHPVRAHIIEQVNNTYCAVMDKHARKAIRDEACRRRAKVESPFVRSTVKLRGKAEYSKELSLPDLLSIVPIEFTSLERAAAFAARPTNPRHPSAYTRIPEPGATSSFTVKFPLSGPDLDRTVNTAVSTMVRARILEDYLSLKGCPVSLATFHSLIQLRGDHRAILLGREVQGIIALNDHLHHNYRELSALERAALITQYGLKRDPVSYFEGARRALLDKLERKRQSTRPAATNDALNSPSERPVMAASMRLSELTAAVYNTLQRRADNTNVDASKLLVTANRIAKLAKKTTITLDDLLGLVSVAADPVEVMAATVRRPQRIDTPSEAVASETSQTPGTKTALNLWQAPETFFNRSQRAELHEIFDRHGKLNFKELNNILKKYFDTTLSTHEGPGSHGLFKRATPTGSFTAQCSPNFRANNIKDSLLNVLEQTLTDLHIEPEAFIEALKSYRNIR